MVSSTEADSLNTVGLGFPSGITIFQSPDCETVLQPRRHSVLVRPTAVAMEKAPLHCLEVAGEKQRSARASGAYRQRHTNTLKSRPDVFVWPDAVVLPGAKHSLAQCSRSQNVNQGLATYCSLPSFLLPFCFGDRVSLCSQDHRCEPPCLAYGSVLEFFDMCLLSPLLQNEVAGNFGQPDLTLSVLLVFRGFISAI